MLNRKLIYRIVLKNVEKIILDIFNYFNIIILKYLDINIILLIFVFTKSKFLYKIYSLFKLEHSINYYILKFMLFYFLK